MSVRRSCLHRAFLTAEFSLFVVALFFGMITSAKAQEREAVLQFFDGSVLQGELVSLEPDQSVLWKHPFAREPIRFNLSEIAWIRFLNATEVSENHSVTPKHHVTFRNGDQIFGEVTEIDETHVTIATSGDHSIKIVRGEVESIRNLPREFTIVREGTATLDGWTTTSKPVATLVVNNVAVQKPQLGWVAHNGKFKIEGAGILGTRLQQQKPTSVSFDLDWTGTFSLVVGFYAASVDQDSYTTYTCHVRIDPGTVSAQTLTDQRRATTLGGQSVPEMLKKSSARFEARVDPREQKIEAFIDGELVKVWTDRSLWQLMGDALIISSLRSDSNLQISNLRVATWRGSFLDVPSDRSIGENDWLFFSNEDEMHGSIKALTSERLEIDSPVAELSVPFERVAFVQFEKGETSQSVDLAEGVQAQFRGGGKVTFVPQTWDSEKVSGHSDRYGKLTFDPSSIEEVRFNLDRNDPVSEAFNSSQSILWEVEEPAEE